MKFNCGDKANERYWREHQWSKWFAWFPVRVATKDCRWLETVERKRDGSYATDDAWSYRSYGP